MTDNATTLFDGNGRPIAPLSRKQPSNRPGLWKLILGFLACIAGLSALLSNLDSIMFAVGLRHYKAPLITNNELIVQGAFAAVYGDVVNVGMNYELFAFPTTNNPFFNDARCFSVPVISFSITNPNDIDMMIDGIDIEASVINTQKVSVGDGQMVAGADYMIYECVLSTNGAHVFAADFKEKNYDYLKLTPGELASIRIYIRSATPGLYRIRSICRYSVGRQSKSITMGEFSDPIYFFAEEPKQYQIK